MQLVHEQEISIFLKRPFNAHVSSLCIAVSFTAHHVSGADEVWTYANQTADFTVFFH